MADLTDLLSQDPELAGLQYKRQLANLLTGQAFNQPQAQMISGHLVKPSALQQALPMINAAIGGFTSANLDTERQKIAQRLRQEQVDETNSILKTKNEKGIEAAYAQALRGLTPAAQRMATVFEKGLTREPNWKETEVNVNGVKVKGLYDANTGDVKSTFRPYSSEVNVPLRAAQYEGKIGANEGGGMPFGSYAEMFKDKSQGQPQVLPQGQSLTLPQNVTQTTPQVAPNVAPPVVAPVVPQAIVKPAVIPANQGIDKNWDNATPIPNLNAAPKPVVSVAPVAPIIPINPKKYDLEIPKQFNTAKERDEWFADSRKPLPSESLKIVNGAESTIKTLRDYNTAIQTFKKEDMLSPDKSAAMYGLTKNAILALKDAKGLGVLNVHDLPQLEAILKDPTDWKNILNSKELFQKLSNNQIDYAGSVIAKNYKNSYKQMPEETKSMLMQIDAEKQQQNKPVATDLSKPLVYNSQSAVEAAGKSGKLQDGQRVVIGTQVFTWRKD